MIASIATSTIADASTETTAGVVQVTDETDINDHATSQTSTTTAEAGDS